MAHPTPARRTVLSAAGLAAVLAATSGCVRVDHSEEEADPGFHRSYEQLDQDGTIVIDARTPGHPTRDELGFGQHTFGGIDHDEPFPVRLELPLGDAVLRADDGVLTQVGSHADQDDRTAVPGHVIVSTAFATTQEAQESFARNAVALALPEDQLRRPIGPANSGGGLFDGAWRGVVQGYEDRDVLVEVEFTENSASAAGCPSTTSPPSGAANNRRWRTPWPGPRPALERSCGPRPVVG